MGLFDSIFGKKNEVQFSVHESLEQQRKDAADSVSEMFKSVLVPLILDGLDCDELPNGIGEFGSLDNPIPVNGSIGEIKYLVKLRGKTGKPIMFHRIGSMTSKVIGRSVDKYELVCLDGTQWSYLHFDFYHPRRSNITPPNFTLIPYNKELGLDIPFGFGSNGRVDSFPHGLPSALIDLYKGDLGIKLAQTIEDVLSSHNFQRPNRL